MKRKWFYQETFTHSTYWSFGFKTVNKRGWEMDELSIFFGPFEFCFLSSTQMERLGHV